MNKNLVTLVLILILVVIIVAASIFIMKGKPTEAPGAHAGDPVPTAAPPRESETPSAGGEGGQSGESGGTAEPIATREPLVTPEPTPVPTPQPTPVPTPKPTPVPADASGSFSSNTGTGLNIRADWQTYRDASGSRKLKVDVSIVSYSIFTSSQYKSITLKVGGNAWSADCAGFSYDGKDQIVTKAASFTVDAPAPGTQISVEWYYGGSYSGKDLHTITATGTVG
jgi:hypothetical protein